MGLRGSLSDVGPLEAIQMISLQNRTGQLTIRSGREKSVIDFVSGAVLALHPPQLTRRSPLVRVLEELGLLEKAEAVAWIDEARRAQGDPLDVLQKLGLFPDEALQNVYRIYSLGVLGKLLRPKRGRFQFHNADIPRSVQCLEPVPADNLLLEGLRRRDEVDELLTGTFSPRVVPVMLSERVDDEPEWSPTLQKRLVTAVQNLCEGRWNLSQILDRSALPEYEILTTLASEIGEGRMRLVGDTTPVGTTLDLGTTSVRRAAVSLLALLGALAFALGLRAVLEKLPSPSLGTEVLQPPRGQAEVLWREEEAARRGRLLLAEFLKEEEANGGH